MRFELNADGKIRDADSGEIYGSVPIELIGLYSSAPDMVLLIQSAKHLLLAATGRDDGPTSWTKTRERWMNIASTIEKTINANEGVKFE